MHDAEENAWRWYSHCYSHTAGTMMLVVGTLGWQPVATIPASCTLVAPNASQGLLGIPYGRQVLTAWTRELCKAARVATVSAS